MLTPPSPLPSTRLWALLGKLFVFGLVYWLVLLHFAVQILRTEVPLAKADWIVVLGGASGDRVMGAAELYHHGIASRIFVTGHGDCKRNVYLLQIAAVPPEKISYECESISTFENAIYTKRFLNNSNPQKIILVTSWFHTARALKIFSREWPSVHFGTLGVRPNDGSFSWLPIAESGAITIEYLKYILYWIRYCPLPLN